MQLIETSAFGVRNANWKFESKHHNITFLLFPMVHVAQPEFYACVSERLRRCDHILYEGVRSHKAKRLTQSYLQMTKNPRLGLVSQSQMDLKHCKDRLLHADIQGESFDEQWENLPRRTRILIAFLAPMTGFYLRHFGTMSMLAQHLSLEDMKSRDELLTDSLEDLDGLLLDKRDVILTEAIENCIATSTQDQTCVGVLYGAEHMRAVIWHLTKRHNFYAAKADWIKVFKL